ncbi:MAG: hypothetical protein IJ324_01290 [Lachnospiraceae bacterium]|nr:hypothetical protein [Lachnospiraceae bacterium]
MGKFLKILSCKPMDEMETHISLRSKSYAQLFTMAALIIWVLYDLIQAAMSYDYEGNFLPWLIILGSICIEDISKHILTKRATADDEEYVAEQKAKRPEQLIAGIVLIVLTAAVSVFLASAFRYLFFQAGILK